MKHEESAKAEKFVVRFPPGMRNWIADASLGAHRSMNAEIIARLQHSMDNWPSTLPLGQPAVAAGDEEQFLLERFRRLPAVKRQALLRVLD
ncbi:Arc family DNA-binding protein [Alloalcanivorax mobilis]|uniref:Arc family DNA-binding protein n=1 Tax=Alloalcanivorax mobilis TaxID=2019569 RepID=UPI000B5B2789|nr:Arc family DNA-binding protein [Alloalcanivorax mobilis]ASK35322.1 transcriptional regulator [Alcanivorax sp. N3-2A]|tara:strand:+ start:4703 stop:4975 length:273 start_codon:yes stop_codon:yes gene_type:complete